MGLGLTDQLYFAAYPSILTDQQITCFQNGIPYQSLIFTVIFSVDVEHRFFIAPRVFHDAFKLHFQINLFFDGFHGQITIEVITAILVHFL